jgi:hypothetical protein
MDGGKNSGDPKDSAHAAKADDSDSGSEVFACTARFSYVGCTVVPRFPRLCVAFYGASQSNSYLPDKGAESHNIFWVCTGLAVGEWITNKNLFDGRYVA